MLSLVSFVCLDSMLNSPEEMYVCIIFYRQTHTQHKEHKRITTVNTENIPNFHFHVFFSAIRTAAKTIFMIAMMVVHSLLIT